MRIAFLKVVDLQGDRLPDGSTVVGIMRPHPIYENLSGGPRPLQMQQVAARPEDMEPYEKLVETLLDGLHTEGGHHKQWVIEKALAELGALPTRITWEPGVAP